MKKPKARLGEGAPWMAFRRCGTERAAMPARLVFGGRERRESEVVVGRRESWRLIPLLEGPQWAGSGLSLHRNKRLSITSVVHDELGLFLRGVRMRSFAASVCTRFACLLH